jgi:hypothetical protein
MKHKFQIGEIERVRKRVEAVSAAVFIAIAVVIYLLTDSYLAALIIPLYKVVWKLIAIFAGIYIEDVESWKEWEIERIQDGLRFHHKNTGSTVKFTDFRKVEVIKDRGSVSDLILNSKNGQRIGIKGYSDMESIYKHLATGVDKGVLVVG